MRLCFTVILYAISAVYFAGVMVRLMLTLTPVVCVLAAIAFSKTFELYLKDDTKKGDSVDSELEQRARDAKYYDKVRVCVRARAVLNTIRKMSVTWTAPEFFKVRLGHQSVQ